MKELSVAIAEASSTIDETLQQQQQSQPLQAPRKRGRPRKIIVRMENHEEKKAQGIDSSMEKVEANEKVQHEHEESSCIRVTEQEEIQLPKVEPSRSKARRKSKPRRAVDK
ncbi:hypothetical protein TanjilG_14713 [Lupinus angustifolius]|uniref:Uncharacterized protein n=1 Tax=Lupinus angustifolius TaxID=3871 RepID=A0A1J7GSG8_LUPAN|nr:hypothetical protein TanjilG_14713 [Lupinus angustifolius]